MKFHNRRVVTALFVSQEKKVKRKSRKEVGGRSLPMRLANRTAGCAFVVSLLLGVAVTETAWAATMPAGSRAWMVFTGNSCGPSELCATSNTLGTNPPNGIPTSTFIGGGGLIQTGSAEILPDRMRSFNSGYGGSHMYASMFDTYTVHGVAGDPFGITVHLAVNGVARAIPVAGTYGLSSGAVALEIGRWDSTTNNIDERSRVTRFDPSTEAMYIVPSSFSSAPFEQDVDVATSYSRTVNVGDVFDIGYNVSTDMAWGELDLRNTAHISFDLPQGVYLTSALGGTFGAPVPVPAAAWLFGSGLLGLIGVAWRKARAA